MKRYIPDFSLLAVAILTWAAGASAQSPTITTFTDGRSFSRPALSIGLASPSSVAVDGSGNFYIANINNNTVYKVDTLGTATIFAGSGICAFNGDGGPAINASLCNPYGVAVDPAGNVVISDTGNNRIRKVDSSGNISTIAGNGICCTINDGGPATGAWLYQPFSVAFDGSGNMYIADRQNFRIRKVDGSGNISTFAGNGLCCQYDTGTGTATSHYINYPWSLTFDSAGNLYSNSNYGLTQKIDSSGNIVSVTYTGFNPGLGIDSSGNMLASLPYWCYSFNTTACHGDQVVKFDSSGNFLSDIAGVGGQYGYNGDGSALSHYLNSPYGIAVDGSNNIFVADLSNQRIRKIDPSGNMATVAGNGNYDNFLITPFAAVVDGSGNLYVADAQENLVWKVSKDASVQIIVAGTGAYGFSGDGPATSNSLAGPRKLALDSSGNLYIADSGNSRIRKVDTAGNMTTVAGNGGNGFSGDGSATSNSLTSPEGVAVDSSGNIFIADTSNQRIRKVDPAGNMTTVSGVGTPGFSGDGGSATAANLYNPSSVAVDAAGNLYIADSSNNRIRKVSAGNISTVVGDGLCFVSNDGPGSSSGLCAPQDVQVAGSGTVLISDTSNNRVLLLYASGDVKTIAGNGVYGYSGDGGSSLSANLAQPYGTTTDAAGNLFIADTQNHRIREVTGAALAEPSADLAISNAASASTIGPSGNITYTINVSDNGPTAANSVTVTDNLPPSVSFVSCSSTGSGVCGGTGNSRTITFSSLANGESETITLVATASSTAADGTVVINTASISSSTLDTDQSNNSSTASVIIQKRADLSIANTVSSSSVAAGSNVTYTLAVTNNGPDAAASVTVADNLPSSLAFVSCSSDTAGVCGGTGSNRTVTFSSLANGTTAIITLVATVNPATSNGSVISNTASVNSNVTDNVPGNNASTAVFTTTGFQKSVSTTVVGSSANPSVIGQAVTFTATVSSGGTGMPTGTITFKDGTTTLGSGTLSGGTATLTTSTLALGSHSVTASYSGDSNFTSSTSSVLKQVVNKIATSTVVTSSSSSVTIGQQVTFTATVSSSAVITDGETVSFKDGSNSLGTASITGGSATLNTSFLTAGLHSITATYSGDTTFSSSTSPKFSETVNRYSTVATVTSSSNPSMFGLGVTFTATLSSPSGQAISGTVTFKNGGATLATQTFTGTNTLTVSTLTVGTHAITVVYNGDTINAPSTSPVISQVVTKAATSTNLVSSLNPSTAGQAVIFTATVGSSTTGTPTGTVTFKSGTAVLGTVSLSSGSASLTTSSLASGSHSITATYNGSGNFTTNSTTMTQVVN